ncbi:hypothetical protein CcaCcLH18_06007 [Colletotrichum camelliae]|nr:hypothetical protein CcaCcLH18_06007 [Colletotrichum camelliae]
MKLVKLILSLAIAAVGVRAASIRDGPLAKDAASYHQDLEEQSYEGDTSSSERRGSDFELVTRQDPIPLNEWVCGRSTGGGGRRILQQLVAVFKQQFGTQGLLIYLQKSTCYASTCRGHFFTVCNGGGGLTVCLESHVLFNSHYTGSGD